MLSNLFGEANTCSQGRANPKLGATVFIFPFYKTHPYGAPITWSDACSYPPRPHQNMSVHVRPHTQVVCACTQRFTNPRPCLPCLRKNTTVSEAKELASVPSPPIQIPAPPTAFFLFSSKLNAALRPSLPMDRRSIPSTTDQATGDRKTFTRI